MAANNFKLFDENKQNMLNDQEYQASQQRLGGVQAGIASSMLNNKFAYQMSLIAYAIAQMMNANGHDATDALAVSAFVGNLSNSVLQKVIDKATTAEAIAGLNDTKWITPAKVKQFAENYDFAAEHTLISANVAGSLGLNPAANPTVDDGLAIIANCDKTVKATYPVAAGQSITAGDVVDVVGGEATKAGTPTQAISLATASAGQSCEVIYSGVVPAPWMTAGQKIPSEGVQGYAPQDGWLWVSPEWGSWAYTNHTKPYSFDKLSEDIISGTINPQSNIDYPLSIGYGYDVIFIRLKGSVTLSTQYAQLYIKYNGTETPTFLSMLGNQDPGEISVEMDFVIPIIKSGGKSGDRKINQAYKYCVLAPSLYATPTNADVSSAQSNMCGITLQNSQSQGSPVANLTRTVYGGKFSL